MKKSNIITILLVFCIIFYITKNYIIKLSINRSKFNDINYVDEKSINHLKNILKKYKIKNIKLSNYISRYDFASILVNILKNKKINKELKNYKLLKKFNLEISINKNNKKWKKINKINIEKYNFNYLNKYRKILSKKNFCIVIDPGHGGYDSGAVGINNIKESDIVLDISLKIRHILKYNNINIIMTREKDNYVSLSRRVYLSNLNKPELFISIHCNATAKMNYNIINGTETYLDNYDYIDLANIIQFNILKVMKNNNRGVKKNDFYVLKYSQTPAILTELGFITGDEDVKKFQSERYRDYLAYAISNGIIEYLINK